MSVQFSQTPSETPKPMTVATRATSGVVLSFPTSSRKYLSSLSEISGGKNGLSGESLRMIRAETPAGTAIPTRTDETERMMVILTGAWFFTVAGESFVAGAGDAVHLPAGVEYKAEVLENSATVEIHSAAEENHQTGEHYLWGV